MVTKHINDLNHFRAAHSPYILTQSGVPVILVPNGTVATNGTITVGTALPATYSGGAWIRLPAGAVVSGSAGLYWCVFSSTTVGQVYTNFSDPVTQFIPTVPGGTLVAAVGSNVAYTQTTGSAITLINATIPAMALETLGAFLVNRSFSYNLAAGNKVFTLRLGATQVSSSSRSTTGGGDSFSFRGRLRGTSSIIHYSDTAESATSSTMSTQSTAIDFSVDTAVTLTCQLDTATNYGIIEAFMIEIFPS